MSRANGTTVRQLVQSGVSDRALMAWSNAARRRLPKHAGLVSIVLIGPALSRQLNRRYRHRDRSTNVLTFTLADAAEDKTWGEIFLCPAVIRREAHEQGRPYRAYLQFLLQHGLIHLCGLDHHTPAEQGRWVRYERRLAKE